RPPGQTDPVGPRSQYRSIAYDAPFGFVNEIHRIYNEKRACKRRPYAPVQGVPDGRDGRNANDISSQPGSALRIGGVGAPFTSPVDPPKKPVEPQNLSRSTRPPGTDHVDKW